MQPAKWQLNTWHGIPRLAYLYGPLDSNDIHIDVCKYTRALIVGAMLLSIVCAFDGAVLGTLVTAMIWGWFSIASNSFLVKSAVAEIGTTLWIIIASVAIVNIISRLWSTMWRSIRMVVAQPYQSKQPGQLAQMYQAYKQKTCFKIEMVDDSEVDGM